jgi:hypothetical protein
MKHTTQCHFIASELFHFAMNAYLSICQRNEDRTNLRNDMMWYEFFSSLFDSFSIVANAALRIDPFINASFAEPAAFQFLKARSFNHSAWSWTSLLMIECHEICLLKEDCCLSWKRFNSVNHQVSSSNVTWILILPGSESFSCWSKDSDCIITGCV